MLVKHVQYNNSLLNVILGCFVVAQVHIALDEQTVENGGLHFVPGSHKYVMDT